MWAPRIWKVGVTGGIGAGKSNIVRILSSQGAAVLDADKLGHRTYEPGCETFNALVNVFGPTIVDEAGRINRAALGSLGVYHQL
jgi:dephospho-CoA kinase